MTDSTVYQIRQTFRVPLDFAFRWCTDYSPRDGVLAGDGHKRRILSRARRRVVYETLYDYPDGWFWSRQSVSLHPPDRWTATAEGNSRHWDLIYTLRPLGPRTTEFTFRGVRTPTGVGRENPSQQEMKAELNAMWKNFGRAMERDFQRSTRRKLARGRPRP